STVNRSSTCKSPLSTTSSPAPPAAQGMNTGIFTGTSMFVVTAAWAGCTISDRRPSAKMGSTQRKFVDRIDFAPIGSPSLLTRGGFQVFLVGFDADGALPQGVAQFLSGKLLFEEAEMSVLPTVLLSSFRLFQNRRKGIPFRRKKRP